MTTAVQGATITLRAYFRHITFELVDPVNPLVSIVDPSGATVVSNATPVRDSLGTFHYSYVVPSDAETGTWQSVWTGTIEGVAVQGHEDFDVNDDSDILSVDELALFRRWVGDSVPRSGEPTNLFFEDAELAQIWANNGGDRNAACSDAWEMKAGEYVEFVDINENGSDRKNSQLYKQASNMRDYYRSRVEQGISDRARNAPRVAGRTFNLYKDQPNKYLDSFGIYCESSSAYNRRLTHRFFIG